MEVIYILIAISIGVALMFLGSFLWAVKSGQFEDQDTPAIRMLFDNKTEKTPKSK
jgi:cbb3-type cytochrome oxidase maturation protein